MINKLSLSILALSAASILFAQTKAIEATYITKDQIQRVLDYKPDTGDHSIKIVDVGPYNVAVGVVHRGPTKDREGVASVLQHHHQTENFVILSGSGTMVTGGAIHDPKEWTPDNFYYKILNGPSSSGTAKLDDPGVTQRVVHIGDVIIIPPDVSHGWIKILEQVTYLSIRPSERVIPAGYVHPAIEKDPK